MVRILLVDDDETVLHSIVRGLPQYDWSTSRNGREALDRVRGEPFDLVISDIRMPEMDGAEFLQRMEEAERERAPAPPTPKIVLTGYGDQEAIDLGLKANGVYRVGKPWGEELETTIQRALENAAYRKRSHQETSEILTRLSSAVGTLHRLLPLGVDGACLIEMDERLRVSDINPAACELLGYARREILGSCMDVLFTAPGECAALVRAASFVKPEQGVRVLEVPSLWKAKDGRQVPLWLSCSVIGHAGDEAMEAVWIAREIAPPAPGRSPRP